MIATSAGVPAVTATSRSPSLSRSSTAIPAGWPNTNPTGGRKLPDGVASNRMVVPSPSASTAVPSAWKCSRCSSSTVQPAPNGLAIWLLISTSPATTAPTRLQSY